MANTVPMKNGSELTGNAKNRIHEYVQAMARLRFDLQEIIDDLKFTQGGGEIRYAVDNDVISLYLFPDSKPDYLRVLGSDDIKYLTALSRNLGHAIFFRNASEKRILLPPYQDEVFETYRWLQRFHPSAAIGPVQEELKQVQQALDREWDVDSLSATKVFGYIDFIEANAPTIIWLLSGALEAAVKALERLFREKRLVTLEDCFGNLINGRSWLDGMDDNEANASEIDHWYEHIRRAKSAKEHDISIMRDARALFSTIHVNKLLSEHGKSHIRLYLLSGDMGMRRAYTFRMMLSKRPVGHPAFLLLRHPRQSLNFLRHTAFSDSRGALAGAIETAGCIDLFLDMNPSRPGSAQRLYDLAYGTVRDPDRFRKRFNAIEGIINKWQGILENSIITSEIIHWPESLSSNSVAARKLLKMIKNKDVNQQLLQRIQHNFRLLWNTYSAMGVVVGTDAHILNMVNNLQRLLETTDSQPQDIWFARIPFLPRYDKIGAKNYLPDLREAIETKDLKHLLPQSKSLKTYTVNLVNSSISAISGDWEKAREYCQQALDSEPVAKDPGRIEAKLFMAVAIRHSQPLPEDYEKACEYLAQAKDVGSDPRFSSEMASQIINFHHCCYYLRDQDEWRNAKKDLYPMHQALTILQDFVDKFEREGTVHGLTPDRENWDWERSTALFGKKQILTNICAFWLWNMYMAGNQRFKVDKDLLRFAVDAFSQISPDQRRFSYYVRTMLDFGKWELESNIDEKRAIAKQLSEFIDMTLTTRPRMVLPYDKKRLAHIKEIVSESITHVRQ